MRICGDRTTGPTFRPGALAQPDLPQRRHAVPVLRRLRPLPAHADEHRRLRLPRAADHGRLDGGHCRRCASSSSWPSWLSEDGAIRRRATDGPTRRTVWLAEDRLRRQSSALRRGQPGQHHCTRQALQPTHAPGSPSTTAAFATSYCQDVLSPDIFDPVRSGRRARSTPITPNPIRVSSSTDCRRPAATIRCIRTTTFSPRSAFLTTPTGSTTTRPIRRRPGSRRRTDWKEILVGRQARHGVPVGMKSPEQLEATGSWPTSTPRQFRHRSRECRAGARSSAS